MKKEKSEAYKYLFLLGLGFLIFGFISYFPYLTLNNDSDLITVNDLDNLDIDPSGSGSTDTSYQYSYDQDKFEQNNDLVPVSGNSESSDNILTLTKVDDKKMGSGIITSYSSQLSAGEIYLVDIPQEVYSSLVLKWDNGELLAGNTKDTISLIEVSREQYVSKYQYLSELNYDLNGSFYIKAEENTKLSIDVFNSITPKLTEGIAQSSELDNSKSGAKYSTLPIKTRNEWGASSSLWDPYSSTDIDDPARFTWYPGYYRASRFVVHHTASPNTADDPSRAVRDIYLYHAYSRGWGDIGYNFLIDQWGNIYEGKAGGDEVYSYHAYTEANTMSVSISLIGNLHTTSPTSAQKESLKKLLAEKSVFYGIPLTYTDASLTSWLSDKITVFGHNDSYFWCYPGHALDHNCPSSEKWVRNITSCPGQYLESVLGREIVPGAASYASAYQNFRDIKNAVNKSEEILSGVNERNKEFIVEYNFPDDVSKATIESKIPRFSGIVDYTIIQNRVIIKVGDWDDGVLVPYFGWTGYGPNTFFPASEGHVDRMRTLIKIFLLDPEVNNVGMKQEYKISPIE